jgi:hypothetical protein
MLRLADEDLGFLVDLEKEDGIVIRVLKECLDSADSRESSLKLIDLLAAHLAVEDVDDVIY